MDEFAKFPIDFPPRGPIPTVSAADLSAAWDFQNELQGRHPGQGLAMDARAYQPVLSPNADIGATLYWLSIFGLLQMMSKMAAFQMPWLRDGKPSEAVFKALAIGPMQGLPVGIPTDKLPLDVDELSSRIQKESEHT